MPRPSCLVIGGFEDVSHWSMETKSRSWSVCVRGESRGNATRRFWDEISFVIIPVYYTELQAAIEHFRAWGDAAIPLATHDELDGCSGASLNHRDCILFAPLLTPAAIETIFHSRTTI